MANQTANSDADQKDGREKPNGLGQRKKKPLVRRYLLLAFLAGAMGLLAQYVESFDHRLLLPSLGLLFGSTILGACGLYILLRNHHATKVNACLFSVLTVLFGLLVCCFLYFFKHDQSAPKPHPHFTLSAYLDDNSTDSVKLTNDFLFITSWNKVITNNGVVCFSKAPDRTNVLLSIVLVNDSDVLAESVEATLLVERKLEFVPDPSWLHGTGIFSNGEEDRDKQLLSFHIPFPLHPGNSVTLPQILIRKADGWAQAWIGIIVKAKGAHLDTAPIIGV